MKFVWTEEDFHTDGRDKAEFYPYGALVGKPKTDETWLIGYLNGTGDNPCLICLSDGNVFARHGSREQMVWYLNENGYFPLVKRWHS